MRGWFRSLQWRPRPAPLPEPQLPVSEALIISKAGLTLAEWMALTNQERAELRWRVRA